jgi:hypothetical protein
MTSLYEQNQSVKELETNKLILALRPRNIWRTRTIQYSIYVLMQVLLDRTNLANFTLCNLIFLFLGFKTFGELERGDRLPPFRGSSSRRRRRRSSLPRLDRPRLLPGARSAQSSRRHLVRALALIMSG